MIQCAGDKSVSMAVPTTPTAVRKQNETRSIRWNRQITRENYAAS
jgi:hypothetical protein